jgi:DNA/RNA non-specific endonuclease
VNVTLDAGDCSTPFSTFVNLTPAVGSASEYLADTQRIGYGSTGFETFTFDVPDRFRGKTATLRFESSGPTVYLDNVFFKSQHLLLGNPTEARKLDNANTYANNYLLEKPQFAISYINNDLIPNWSAWQLNADWTGGASRPSDYFFGDPAITSLGWIGVDKPDYKGKYSDGTPKGNLPQLDPNGKPYKLAPGHLTPVDQRDRSIKDIWSTYLTTNIVPKDSWRVVVIDRPGLGLVDINSSNTHAFALIAENELPNPGQSTV